eukprot:TRINITY_DN5384_c2_g1_i1.p1 TRINITY_DN5384_c2_g1~~TRINITY_DN5384_c2_g1_i1.p1  ORF type:complete len:301 (+),score=52.91 TRINITY_DN5384_c2_g1_i1:376-1278(+)
MSNNLSFVTNTLSESIRSAPRYAHLPKQLRQWPHSKEPHFNIAQCEWVRKGPSMVWESCYKRFSPAISASRFMFYDSLLNNMTVSHSFLFPNYFAAGFSSELLTRAAIHPIIGAVEHFKANDEGRRLIRSFTGHPSIAVESLNCGMVFGIWGYSFDSFGNNPFRIVSGTVGGVIGTVAAGCLVHPIRQFVHQLRLERTIDSCFMKYNPSAFLPVTELLASRLPHAAVMFSALSTAAHFFYPDRSLRNPEEVKLSKYGEPIPSSDGCVPIAVYAGATIPERQAYQYREKRVAQVRAQNPNP